MIFKIIIIFTFQWQALSSPSSPPSPSPIPPPRNPLLLCLYSEKDIPPVNINQPCHIKLQ